METPDGCPFNIHVMFDSLFSFFLYLLPLFVQTNVGSSVQRSGMESDAIPECQEKRREMFLFLLLYSCTKLATYTFSPLFIDLMMTMNVYDRID